MKCDLLPIVVFACKARCPRPSHFMNVVEIEQETVSLRSTVLIPVAAVLMHQYIRANALAIGASLRARLIVCAACDGSMGTLGPKLLRVEGGAASRLEITVIEGAEVRAGGV